MSVYPGKLLEENISSCQHSLKDYMIYVKQQSPCIGECQNPQLGAEVIFHANSELFIMEGKKQPNKTCFHMQHLSVYHLIVIRLLIIFLETDGGSRGSR